MELSFTIGADTSLILIFLISAKYFFDKDSFKIHPINPSFSAVGDLLNLLAAILNPSLLITSRISWSLFSLYSELGISIYERLNSTLSIFIILFTSFSTSITFTLI